jgi:hypothetical protein
MRERRIIPYLYSVRFIARQRAGCALPLRFIRCIPAQFPQFSR